MDGSYIPVSNSTPDKTPRFSLGFLWFLTTVAAVVSWVLFYVPNWIALPMVLLLMLVIPAMFTTLLIYDRGFWRPISIGVLVPYTVTLFPLAFIMADLLYDLTRSSYFDERFTAEATALKVFAVFCWITCSISGALCYFVWRGLQRCK